MPQPLIAGLPPDCQLQAGYVVRITALEPTTGTAVSGVSLSEVSLFCTDLFDNVPELAPMPLLVPSTETV